MKTGMNLTPLETVPTRYCLFSLCGPYYVALSWPDCTAYLQTCSADWWVME